MKTIVYRFLFGITGAAWTLSAFSATLGLAGAGAVVEGETILLPITLGSSEAEAVAGFQFDVYFDNTRARFESAKVGPSAAEAEKSAHANLIRAGQLRIVAAGFNRHAIPDGEVLQLTFTRLTVGDSELQFQLRAPLLSDPFGTAVPVSVAPDTLVVRGASAVAMGASEGGAVGAVRPFEVLARYRALLFALVVVAFTMVLARTKPKKRRVR